MNDVDDLVRVRCDDHPDVTPKRNLKHEAWYCPTCRAWLSPRCARHYCQYCKGRPEKAPVGDESEGAP